VTVPSATRTLLAGATLVPCTGEAPFAGDLLVEGDRIAGVFAGPAPVDPASVRTVDLAGATVLPGLCDAHTHISWPLDFVFDHAAVAATPVGPHMLDVASVVRTYLESGYTLLIGAGVTQPRDDVDVKEAIEAGIVPGPRLVPGGTMIAEEGGLGSDGGLMAVVSGAGQIRDEVRRQCETGVRSIKLFISGDGVVPQYPSDDVYMNDAMLEAAVDEAARAGAIVVAHARGAQSVAMAARTGVKIIHHACFLDDAALTALEARRDDVWVCPGIHYLYAMVEGLAEPWGMTPEKIDRSGYRDEFQAQVDGLHKLRAAGIRILAGGDFGHQWTRHGTYAAELERYVELAGMTPVEALHTASANFGPLLGLEWGQVAPGYLADLQLVKGDPSTDVGVLQDQGRRRAVIKDGEVVYVNPGVYP
jgi:imidazolonepropionase-like amidohydrolase